MSDTNMNNTANEAITHGIDIESAAHTFNNFWAQQILIWFHV